MNLMKNDDSSLKLSRKNMFSQIISLSRSRSFEKGKKKKCSKERWSLEEVNVFFEYFCCTFGGVNDSCKVIAMELIWSIPIVLYSYIYIPIPISPHVNQFFYSGEFLTVIQHSILGVSFSSTNFVSKSTLGYSDQGLWWIFNILKMPPHKISKSIFFTIFRIHNIIKEWFLNQSVLQMSLLSISRMRN